MSNAPRAGDRLDASGNPDPNGLYQQWYTWDMGEMQMYLEDAGLSQWHRRRVRNQWMRDIRAAAQEAGHDPAFLDVTPPSEWETMRTGYHRLYAYLPDADYPDGYLAYTSPDDTRVAA